MLVGNLKLMRGFSIVHDNGSKHSSKLIQKFLQYKNMKILSFLLQNSDINITENLWNELKRHARSRKQNTLQQKKKSDEIYL